MSLQLDYDSPTALRAFLDARGMAMQKKFGQNFMVNPRSRQALLDSLDAKTGDMVWEVGPGLGAMTRGLLDRGLRVRMFEIDRGFAQALREIFEGEEGVSLVEGDALKTLFTEAASGLPRYFFGNLPYNIAATLLAQCVERGLFFERQVITVQKEVAQRMAASVGKAEYSSISVLLSSVYHIRYTGTLKPGCFWPQPHVDSASLLLERRSIAELSAIPPLLNPMVRTLFENRRKMISNTLERFVSARSADGCDPKDCTRSILEAAGIPGTERVERLSGEALAALATSAGTFLGVQA